MNQETLLKVFEHAKYVDQWCAENGGIRVYTALFGSQNYGLDNENSDVDTKSIVVPELNDWTWGDTEKYNKTLVLPDGSHAEVKTLTDMCKQYIKCNINFLETLYTDYIDIAPGWEWLYYELTSVRDKVSKHNLYKTAQTWLGYERQAIERAFNSTSESLGYKPEYGYNPKSLMNAFRIKESFIRFFYFNRPFDEAINVSEMRSYLLEIKENPLPLEIALTYQTDLFEWINKAKTYIEQKYYDKETFNCVFYFQCVCKLVYAALVKEEVVECG